MNEDDLNVENLKDLILGIAKDGSDLIQCHADLLKIELKESLQRLAQIAVVAIAAISLALTGLILLSLSVARVASSTFGWSLSKSEAIIGVIILALSGLTLLGLFAVSSRRRIAPRNMEQMIEQ